MSCSGILKLVLVLVLVILEYEQGMDLVILSLG